MSQTCFLSYYPSPLGTLALASDGQAVTGIWFKKQKYFASGVNLDDPGSYQEVGLDRLPVFIQTKTWLDSYFAGHDPGPIPPVKVSGAPFQEAVWRILREIPYGRTTTYGRIADRLAKEEGKEHMSAQAVGFAVGHNKVSLLIPCHRILGAGGKLTGYAAGLDVKERLLALEKAGSAGSPDTTDALI